MSTPESQVPAADGSAASAAQAASEAAGVAMAAAEAEKYRQHKDNPAQSPLPGPA